MNLLWLIPVLPLLGAAFNGILGKRLPKSVIGIIGAGTVLGSFLIGLVQEIALTTLVPAPTVRLFLTVGVLGGFTTYSSFSYETVRLLEEGSWLRAGLNVGVTTVACLGACVLGLATGRACVAFREGG